MKSHRLALACAVLTLAAGLPAAEAERTSISLPHKGDVFGQGGDWDKQYAREALQLFKDLKPDPAWVAKLRDLADNTWTHAGALGEQQPERGRGEVPMVYAPDIHAFVFCCGCTSPGYSSDTWVFHTGANRWVQMWPNFIKGGEASKLNRGPCPKDRPFTRCSLGLGYDTERKTLVLHGGANSNDATTWAWNTASNEWAAEAPSNAGYVRAGDNCVGYAPGFGVVEIGGDKHVKAADTWVYKPQNHKWEKLATKGAPPGGHNSKLVWAAKSKRLIYWAPMHDQLWAFDPSALAWEDISPKEEPKPKGFYRHGMAYDSANDVVIMFGTKPENNPQPGGPWVYAFASKTWQDMQTPAGPNPVAQGLLMDYDSEYNVVFLRGGWFYRYRKTAGAAAEAGK